MEFPRFVFCSPGPMACNGGTYGHELVKSQSEFDAAVKAGWSQTLPEALGANRDKGQESKAPKEPKAQKVV